MFIGLVHGWTARVAIGPLPPRPYERSREGLPSRGKRQAGTCQRRMLETPALRDDVVNNVAKAVGSALVGKK